MMGPLSGLRVVEVSAFIAFPPGGMTVAQLGAEVGLTEASIGKLHDSGVGAGP